jgi:hypothetical protein
MIIDRGTATLIAAIIAAISSLIVLFSKRGAEIRTARRKSLEKYISDLSSSIHQLIATSNILLKAKTSESQTNWKVKAESAKDQLKKIRPELTYSLWGIDSSLQTLSRLPDFTAYTLEDNEIAKKVVKRGTKLGDAINKCIKNCYLNGRAPSWWEIRKIKFYEWRFRKVRNDYKKNKSA